MLNGEQYRKLAGNNLANTLPSAPEGTNVKNIH